MLCANCHAHNDFVSMNHCHGVTHGSYDCRFMRELPYGQDVLLENLVDPSHVEYAHHGVFGGRDKHLISRMSVVGAVQQETGCTVHVRDTIKDSLPDGSPVTRKIEFRPPTLVRWASMSLQSIIHCCCSCKDCAHAHHL